MQNYFKVFISFIALLFVAHGCTLAPPDNTPIDPTITISADSVQLFAGGDTVTIRVTVTPTPTSQLVWISDNEEVATVFYGIITSGKAGVATVTATCDDLQASCVVTVINQENEDFPPIGEYEYVWSDEFDGNTLNAGHWNIEVNGDGGGNRELQYYRAENVSVGAEPATGNSCLILTAKKENFSGKTATSGRITSRSAVTFTHGLIEARIKLPYTANGLWPAFWLMGNDYSQVGWPACGEIDILEMGNVNGIRNNTQDRYFNGACHWGQSWNGGAYPNYANAVTNSYSVQGDFHTFRLYWDDARFAMYLDQDVYPNATPYFEMAIADASSENSPGQYFHKPVFILFNLAVGGNFTNIWDIDGVTALNDGQREMYVDYVRIYQKGVAGEAFWKK
jgi:beta-glucanase (GH16 family)